MSSISVFGLGYVGCVSAACFAKEGHDVIGVDVSVAKVDMINAGQSTIVEEGIASLVHEMRSAGRLSATTSVSDAISWTTISLIAVGTPSRSNGSIDLTYIERVAEQIGTALSEKSEWHTIVVRSTVMPGTIDDVVIPAIERTSRKRHGNGFAVCSNPEFLREGTSIRDFYDPPFTLIGAHEDAHAQPIVELYWGIDAPHHVVSIRVAEMVKYVCNCFHGLKVGFANEIGNVCKALGVDSHEVMRIFCEDRKLNISPAYLKPGFAFGGSCLPKDIRALTHRARIEDVEMPVLESLLDSNRKQVERAYRMVLSTGKRKVGVIGLAFKSGTDDLRESPMVSLIELLIGKGIEITVYDPNVSAAGLMGSNLAFIEREIPHIWQLMRSEISTVIGVAEVVVIGNKQPELERVEDDLAGKMVVDLVRAFPGSSASAGYNGICW
jgi:GDP-mannose 6-dehydrogenase